MSNSKHALIPTSKRLDVNLKHALIPTYKRLDARQISKFQGAMAFTHLL